MTPAMILKSYKGALAIARQRGDEPTMRSLQREISRLHDDDLIAEMTALGPVEVIRQIRLVAQEPTYSGTVARRILGRLQPSAFEPAIRKGVE